MHNSNQQLIIHRVQECLDHASNYFGKSFEPPDISFNQRGKVAGCARLEKNELRFNPILLKDNVDVFLEEVVPHEICHLLAYQLFGKVRPHGPEWKGLMSTLFSLKGHTYHQMDVTKVKGKSFSYECLCGPVELGIRRHNKVIRGEQQYICRKCQSPLVVSGIHAA